jgi:hypothetical protein
MEHIVKEIHESDTFGCFIETGCGVPVTNALLNVSGASKTVYMTESPYSKHYSSAKYQNDEFRAVSVENVQQIIKKVIIACNTTNVVDSLNGVNTVYVASFQIGPGITTHGWIGLHCKGYRFYYHITINDELSRAGYIERIAENGLKLIHAQNKFIPEDCDVDIVLNSDLSVNNERSVEFMLNSYRPVYLNFATTGLARLEDTFREKDYIILYKGSFNPPTVEHVRIAESSKEKYENNAFSFMISANTVDKGLVPVPDILQRVKWINSLGYGVIVNMSGMFQSAIDLFHSKFGANLVFPVGQDTYDRMVDYKFDFKQKVIVDTHPRTEISSTQARTYIEEADYENLFKIVPTIVADTLVVTQ